MMEQQATEKERTDRMLILGFDAGCGTCRDIANRVEGRVGDALAVRNLSDPELMSWREEALGKDAPWAPTLFEVEGETVRAWTGKKMALPLSRKLGLSRTWQLMQALGDMPNSGIQPIDSPGVGMSRGKFLKGVGGAAVAMSVLSGVGPLASVVQAAGTSPYDVVQSTSIKGAELESLSRRIALNADMRAIAGNALSTPDKIKASKPSAGRVKLRNGTFITTIVYGSSTRRIMVHASYSRPIGRSATSIAKAVVGNDGEFVITKVSEGGYLWRRPANISPRTSSRAAPLGECPPETGSNGGSNCAVYYTNECLSWQYDANCLARYGVVGGVSCLGCVAGLLGTLRGKEDGKVAAVGCGSCTQSLNFSNLEGCATCRYPSRVKRYDYSRC